jgi:hypothetical protein
MKRSFLGLWVLCFIPMRLFAWTNGELLIWMDTDRGHALKPIAQRFEKHFGIKATIETPEKITDSFSLAAQAAKGPDSDGAFPTGGVAIPGYFGHSVASRKQDQGSRIRRSSLTAIYVLLIGLQLLAPSWRETHAYHMRDPRAIVLPGHDAIVQREK